MHARPVISCVRFRPLIAALALAGLSPLTAQTIVTTTADENDSPAGPAVSLREAIRETASGGTITFAPPLDGMIFVLPSGQLSVAGRTVTVDASALSRGIVIDARKAGRHFEVAGDAGLNLVKLTLLNGKAPASGGAILNGGTLTLTDCVLRNNEAAAGANGAAGRDGRGPTIFGGLDYVPCGNGGTGQPGSGGGAVRSTGPFTAVRCHFVGNRAGHGGSGGNGGSAFGQFAPPGGCGGNGNSAGHGGAVESTGSLTLTECVFEKNEAGIGGTGGNAGSGGSSLSFCGSPGPMSGAGSSGSGGAVWQQGALTAGRCTFVANKCWMGGHGGNYTPQGGQYGPGNWGGSGGAVFANGGTVLLTNCTLSGNFKMEGNPYAPAGAGSGLFIGAAAGADSRLVHCTITGNEAGIVNWGPLSETFGHGSGLFTHVPVVLENCLIAGNRMEISAGIGMPSTWKERNTAGDGVVITSTPASPFTDDPAVDPGLSPLVLSGGALVRPLLPASPALNAGAVLANGPATDQRGLPRASGLPDLGAVEVQSTEPAVKTPQQIDLSLPLTVPMDVAPKDLLLPATATSGLPVIWTVLSGAATLNGNTLSISAPGIVALRAEQSGNAEFAPAPPASWTIEATRIAQEVPFTPQAVYYSGGRRTLTLPEASSRGLPLTWTFDEPLFTGAGLENNVLTVNGWSEVYVRAAQEGSAYFAPVSTSFLLRFTTPEVKWTLDGTNQAFLAEGSTAGVNVTATLSGTLPDDYPLVLSDELTADKLLIMRAGHTSRMFYVTATDDRKVEGDHKVYVGAAMVPLIFNITDNDVAYLRLRFPSMVLAGAPVRIIVSSETTDGSEAPSLDGKTLSFTAKGVDVAVAPAVFGPLPAGTGRVAAVDVTFPRILNAGPHGTHFIVTASDGLSTRPGDGSLGVIYETASFANTDGDGIDDLVEYALGSSITEPNAPLLTVDRDNAGNPHVILANQPRHLTGWKVDIELSLDLQTWAAAPAAATTVTANADGITEKVDVELTGTGPHYARLKVTVPQ